MAGRPRKILDAKFIRHLASKGRTVSEIAAFCNVHPDTIRANYSEDVKRGEELRNGSLRRKQVQLALKGNATMLIWLGKQHLGQSDKVEHSGKGGMGLGLDGLPVSAEFRNQPPAVNKPN